MKATSNAAKTSPASKNANGVEKSKSTFRLVLGRLVKNKLAITGGIVFAILCLLAIFAPLLTPYDWSEVDALNKYCRPCLEHLFGTDQYGRDIFTRMLYGGRWSISMGLCGTLGSAILGIIIGSIAGYFGGKVDMIIMRFIDVVQCIPRILLTVCISVLLGSGFVNTVIALSVGGIWGTARMLRGQILSVRENEYVEAAKATNNKPFRIIMKHVLPNAIQPTIINTCLGIGGTIMNASGLSFLGLGVQPPLPEWGAMLNDGRYFMRYFPNMLIGPCLMIALTILSISFFGDGLRDAMDPRLKESSSRRVQRKNMEPTERFPMEKHHRNHHGHGGHDARHVHGDELLKVKHLSVEYTAGKKIVYAVNDVSFEIRSGESLGLVGESGCGKSTIAKAILRTLPDTGAYISGGGVFYEGHNLMRVPEEDMERIRGSRISMVFQDPMTALNPVQRVLTQVSGVIALHNPQMSRREAKQRAIEMLKTVGITEDRARDYPYQFSGGMQQRVEVAIALSCNPDLLLADEPTTALDVTIQAQVLDMMTELMKKRNTALLLITHNLGIVAETCDYVAVIYGGEIMEYGSKEELFDHPSHPYTIGLFGAVPDINTDTDRLQPIEGIMPEPSDLPAGCKFHTRCPYATEACSEGPVPVVDLGGTHQCKCHNIEAVLAARKEAVTV